MPESGTKNLYISDPIEVDQSQLILGSFNTDATLDTFFPLLGIKTD